MRALPAPAADIDLIADEIAALGADGPEPRDARSDRMIWESILADLPDRATFEPSLSVRSPSVLLPAARQFVAGCGVSRWDVQIEGP